MTETTVPVQETSEQTQVKALVSAWAIPYLLFVCFSAFFAFLATHFVMNGNTGYASFDVSATVFSAGLAAFFHKLL